MSHSDLAMKWIEKPIREGAYFARYVKLTDQVWEPVVLLQFVDRGDGFLEAFDESGTKFFDTNRIEAYLGPFSDVERADGV